MVMRQQPLYTPAVRSSREHPPDERQLSASPRAAPFPSQDILQCRLSTWRQPEAASASCSLPCCRLALFYALRAAMAPRRHARATPQKGLILLTNHAEARVKRERVGHPLSEVVEHLLHPSVR